MDEEDDPSFADKLHAALKKVGERAKEEAFAKGCSVCYFKDGVMVWEHPDGSIVPHDGSK